MTPVRAALLLAASLLLEAALVSCGARASPSVPVRVAVPPLEQNALLYVAAEEGFFQANGIRVSVLGFDSGPASIAAVQSGVADIAETAEFPLVVETLEGRPLRILAANDRFENDYLVARRDRGISSVSDLKGKRIGVTLGTITEFYLGRFLTLHGLTRREVTEVDVRPEDFERSLAGGRVDALVAWQPYVSRMVKARPGVLQAWPVQSGQAVYGILVCKDSWLGSHARAVRGFLESLASAEHLVARHPAQSRAIVARTLGYDRDYMSAVWSQHEFSLTLDFSLVTAMEDEARWLMARRATVVTELPDFAAMIYRKGLAAARPEGVELLR